MSVTTNDVLEISSGVVSTGMTIGSGGEVLVLDGGTLADSWITDSAYVWVDAGGSAQNISASNVGNIFLEGSATNLQMVDRGQFDVYAGGKLTSATLSEKGYGAVYAGGLVESVMISSGGSMLLSGGVAEQTVVSGNGSLTVQEVTGLTKITTILAGGSMLVDYGATAQNTTVNGGIFEVRSGTADETTLDGGSMAVKTSSTVQNTTVKDGTLELVSATAAGTVVSGGQVKAQSASTLQNVTMTGGQLTAEGGSISKISIGPDVVVSANATALQDVTVTGGQVEAGAAALTGAEITAGTAALTGMTIDGLTVGKGASVTMDGTSVIVGKATFATDANVAISGTTIAFNTAVATSTEAQIKGLSVATGDAVYTLTAEPELGVYLLADGVEGFDSDVTFGEYTLRIDGEPIKIGELVYSLNLNGGVLDLTVEEYVPPVPGVVTLAYANSEWAALEPGTEVMVGSIPAVIGLNAFAKGDAAVAAVADVEEGKVCVAGGTVSFTSGITKNTSVYSGAVLANPDVAATGSLTVNKGATLVGKATFAEGSHITINGTVAFDTAYATAESAQITVSSAPGGKASFTLNVADPKVGEYQLLAGLSSFEDGVTFDKYTLTVGAAPVTIDGLDYALNMGAGNVLTLSITNYVPPLDNTPPTVSDVKASTTAPTNQNVVVTAVFEDDVQLASSLYKLGDAVEWTPYPVGGVSVSENGIVYFKAVDAAGNESEVVGCTVSNIDKIPPVAPSASADITVITNQNVTVTAVFSDDSSKKEFSMNGTSWSVYSSPVVFTENGTVYFRGTDAAGNISEVTGYTVSNIDKTIPATDITPPTVTDVTVSVTTPTNQDVVVTAVFADDVEVASSLYKIGDGEWTAYPVSGVTVSQNTVVSFKAIDTSDNESPVVGCTVSNIDKVAPTIDITPSTTEPAESVTVTAVFADDVQLDSSLYRLGEAGEWLNYKDIGVTVFENLTVYFQATDTAGNETTASYTVTNIPAPEQDDTPPVVLNVKADITTPTDQDVTVTAEFTDNVAVAASLYRIGDGEWIDYPAGGVVFSVNGTVSFKAVDTSGNESEIVGYTVSNIEKPVPDTEAPTLVYAKANITKPTNKDVTVTALFSDNVGVVSTQYRIGDGEWTDYTAGVTLSENATVYFRASDAAGNVSEIAGCTVSNIDKTLPDGQAKVYVNSGWADYDYGTPVETYVGGNATVGVNAFGTGDEANNAVDGDGYIFIENGDISFSTTAHNIYVYAQGGLVVDNEAGLDNVIAEGSGTVYMSKGVMTNCKVLDDGRLYVESGAIVDGLTVDAPQDVGVAVNGGTVKNVLIGCLHTEFDSKYACSMSVVSEGGLVQDVTVTSGGRLFVSSGARVENVTLTGDVENYLEGTLYMENDATASGVMVSSGGYLANAGTVNDLTIIDGQGYTGGMVNGAFVQNGVLGINAGGVASDVKVGASGNMWTVDSAGTGTVFNTEVQSGGSLSNQGQASGTHILGGGTMSITGFADATTVESGGFVHIDGRGVNHGLALASGGTVNVTGYSYGDYISYSVLTGEILIEEGATVTMTDASILDFDISGRTGAETTPLVSGYSFISGTPNLTLTVSDEQAAGVYLLADGLTSFDRVVALGEYELTVGGEPVTVGDLTYSLGLADGVLSVTVGSGIVPDNGPDNGWNNVLWDKKTKTPNMDIYNGDSLVIDGDTTTVSIDIKGSVSVERPDGITYNNFVGKITGKGFDPDTDPADYRKIELDKGARLSFSVTAQSAGKFVIYQITESWNEKKEITEYKLKAVQTTKLSLKKNAANVTVDTKAVYLEAGTFFLAMEGTIDKKKDTEGFYNVEMRYIDPAEDAKNQGTKFYTDDDDGSNNWVYDKKNKETPVNPAVYGSDPFVINADTNHVQVDKAGTVYYEDEYGFTWENFVGFGDDTDFVRIDLDAPSQLCFSVQATGAAKMIVYCLETGMDKNEEPTYKLKALQTTSLKKQKFEMEGEDGEVETFEMYVASTKDLLLDRPADNQQYFIAVQSTKAKKGDEVYYTITRGVSPEDDCVFYTDADDGSNNWLYDKKLNVRNADEHFATVNLVIDGEPLEDHAIVLDKDAMSGEGSEGWSNFVGFGDDTDYAKLTISCDMQLEFTVTATDAAKFTLWEIVPDGVDKEGNPKYKAGPITYALKRDKNDGLYKATITGLFLTKPAEGAGDFYLSMEATNAKKGSITYYNVSVNAYETVSEASALDMPELSGGLGGFDTGDALASVGSVSGINDFAALDDKSAWQSLLA